MHSFYSITKVNFFYNIIQELLYIENEANNTPLDAFEIEVLKKAIENLSKLDVAFMFERRVNVIFNKVCFKAPGATINITCINNPQKAN